MSKPMDVENFVQQLTGCQDRLFAYILSLLPEVNQARDVLQETNLAIWRSVDQADEIEHFAAWACRIAYFQVLTQRRKFQRERLLFDEGLLSQIAAEAVEAGDDLAEQQAALHHCLTQLTSEQRDLIQHRYQEGGSVKELAEQLGRSAGALASSLHRIRRLLFECIQRTMRQELGP